MAESHGFTGVMASDHFQPWVPAQGESSFVWSVLGAMGGTHPRRPRPGGHDAGVPNASRCVAQATATLAALYPGRHWLGLGSGDALNEHVVGGYWPSTRPHQPHVRGGRRDQGKLFAGWGAGRDVRHGPHFQLESTRLWTMRATAPEIFVATSGP